MSSLLRGLILGLGLISISQHVAIAQDACPDMPRAVYDGIGYGSHNVKIASYWVIPSKGSRSSVNIPKTFNNLINGYILNNKPTYSCFNGYENCVAADGRSFRGNGDSIIPNKSGGVTEVYASTFSSGYGNKIVISCRNRNIQILAFGWLSGSRDLGFPDLPYILISRKTYPIVVRTIGDSPSF